MECALCKRIKQPTKDIKTPCFPCDSCRNLICLECTELSSSEIKCLPLQKRLMKFHCIKCRNNEFIDILKNTINDKECIINDKNEIIRMLQEKLADMEAKINEAPKPLYSDVVCDTEKRKINHKFNIPDIIVKPKGKQDSGKTMIDINQNINPANLKIGVKNIRTTKTGAIIMKCQSKIEMEILEQEIKNKLGGAYEVEQTKMRKPRVKIVNFNQDLTTEEIENCIFEQNGLMGEFKITYIWKKKEDQITIYGECSGTTFTQLMKNKKIFIGWQSYMVYEDLGVPRCFRCQDFYHKKQQCNHKLVCPICSGEHEERECPKDKVCCNNCMNSNKKYKTAYSINHHTTDHECPTLNFHIKILQNKTNYHS